MWITGRTHMAKAIIIGMAVSAIGIFSYVQLGVEPKIMWAGPNAVIGGLLFGFGIVLAGGCETGWMYRAVEGKVGSGELQIATAQATGWRFPGATATCPTGKRVTGGGGICTSRTGYIWLTRSFPSANNSWSAACDTTEDQNGSITVYAICQ
ncbi:YeeE/YedE thiosulfate transporter family protein [Escherichia coli]|uniref:YeeE/YedE thiosulfate transporter family protein n=1 Tax=Escherichia coli TaxID=562 RepID=UPI0009335476|nr:YeeE/YedE thiosulfate transporter family protein [Escherichia coli]